MDATSPGLIDFVVVPVETIVACNFILNSLFGAVIQYKVSGVAEQTEELRNTGASLVNDIASWPLIVAEHSRCHNTIKEIHEAASDWLRRSPLFEETRNELAQYLELPAGFSASTLRMRDNGAILDRSAVLLKQTTNGTFSNNIIRFGFRFNAQGSKQQYRVFLTQYMWMWNDPLARMFRSDFKGEFQDRSKVTDIGGLSHQLESLSVVDGSSTVAMDTPSTTRATSPALTERQGDFTANRTTESKPAEPPTLKYIAVIETATEKAIFNLDIKKVDEKQHKILVNAKDMCNEMASKSFDGKTKLQDVMDMTVQMATKWEEVREKQEIQKKKIYGGFGYY